MPKAKTGAASDPLSRQLAERRFSQLYAEHWGEILEYALRRLADPEDAAEVLEDSFLVTWRRLAEVPDGEEARLWLYGVARRTLANHRRGERRRAGLAERLAGELVARPPQAPPGPEAVAIRAALGRLPEGDREVLLLAGWEELTPKEIARVLRITAVSCRSRLLRARRRLRHELSEGTDGHPIPARHRSEEAR